MWLWGTENRTQQEKHEILKKELKEHDEMFDSKFLGIQQFEEWFFMKFVHSNNQNNIKFQKILQDRHDPVWPTIHMGSIY